MKQRGSQIGLLLVGAWPRLVGAALISLALWAGFFWATGTPLSFLGGS